MDQSLWFMICDILLLRNPVVPAVVQTWGRRGLGSRSIIVIYILLYYTIVLYTHTQSYNIGHNTITGAILTHLDF